MIAVGDLMSNTKILIGQVWAIAGGLCLGALVMLWVQPKITAAAAKPPAFTALDYQEII